MNRVLAIKVQSDSALAVVVRVRAQQIIVESAARIPLEAGDDAKARGRALAEGLAEIHHGRMQTIVVVPRSELAWQNHELPPVPADDLPDLVHMQAQRDLPLSDDGEGFDFLPLAGGEDHPYKVIATGLLPSQWKQLRDTCDAADLKVDRIVPEPLGWPELGRLVASDSAGALTVFAAIVERQATVWATEGDDLRLLRTVWLPEDDNATADAAALGGELRRTLLSLAQSQSDQRGAVKCVYIGLNADEIAGELGATLSKPVQAVSLERLVDASAAGSTVNLVELAPVAALAVAAAEHRPSAIDLLHPRRRPAPPSRTRIYALAGAAAAALAALIAWQGYRNIQEPLEAAAEANATRVALEPALEVYAQDEIKAAAIEGWLDSSVNLLAELDYLGRQLRPEPLNSEKFKADEDVVLTKLTVSNRELTLDAAVKSNSAIQPIESRLRAADYRVDRGPVEPKAEGGVPGYGVSVVGTIERTAADGAAGEGGQP